MRIYIAGPMTGYPNWNHDAFDTARDLIADAGHDPVSPADVGVEAGLTTRDHRGVVTVPPEATWERSLRVDLGALVTCDAVAFLPGWESSRGAALEHSVALRLGLRRFVINLDAGSVSPVLVVGVSGYARSGKDTVAAGLAGRAGFVRVGFADALKRAALAIDPYISTVPANSGPLATAGVMGTLPVSRLSEVVHTMGWEAAKTLPDVRRLLQRIGDEAGRRIHGEHVWVEAAFRCHNPRLVISDVRYPNETEAIKAAGGLLIRVERPGVGPANGHTSETALDGWHFDTVLINNSTVEDLQGRAVLAVQGWLAGIGETLGSIGVGCAVSWRGLLSL